MATLQMNFLSMKLGMQTNVTVCLPGYTPSPDNAGKSYEELYPTEEKFRTLWLLGTAAGDDGEWLRESGILRLADKHRIALVFPCTYEKLYSDEPEGQKFSEAIADELYAVCTGMFPLSLRREDNIIGGAQLGAYGALKCALTRPEKYGSVIMLGGVYEQGVREGYFSALNAELIRCGLTPHCGLDEAVESNAELKPLPDAPLPAVWLARAADDPLAPFACRAVENLRADGFNVLSEHIYEGPDDWDFRDRAIRDALSVLCSVWKEDA